MKEHFEKKFGLSVLLKLVKAENSNIKIIDNGKEITVNCGLRELDEICSKILEKNNIKLVVS